MSEEGVPSSGGASNINQFGSATPAGSGNKGPAFLLVDVATEIALVVLSFGLQVLYFAYRALRARLGPSARRGQWDEASTWFHLGSRVRLAWLPFVISVS